MTYIMGTHATLTAGNHTNLALKIIIDAFSILKARKNIDCANY